MTLKYAFTGTVALAVACMGSALPQTLQTGEAPRIFYGNWAIDVAQSHPDPGLEPYKCAVEHIEPEGGEKIRVRLHRIRSSGVVLRADEHTAFDGVDRPALQPGVTIAYTITGPRTYQMVNRQGKTIITVVTREISDDGTRMTHLGQGVFNGKPFTNQLVFVRSGEPRSGECHID